jgi:hypothetical protein
MRRGVIGGAVGVAVAALASASSVTGQTYTMVCTQVGSVCQGGNNAVV